MRVGPLSGLVLTLGVAALTAACHSASRVTVSLSVTGSGSVTSSPEGIACPRQCVASFPDGQAITLTAQAGAGDHFIAWTGACSGSLASCTLTRVGDAEVGARFSTVAGNHTLTSLVTGPGSVTSAPAGIACPGNCSASFGGGTSVALTAVPGSAAWFTAWTGPCSGTGACTVVVTSDLSVGADFAASGGPDGGAADAGAPDGGSPDAGAPDGGPGDGGIGAACAAPGGCLPGETCWNGWPGGYCYVPCLTSCFAGAVCRSDPTSPGGTCEKACEHDGDCGRSGYRCVANGCMPCDLAGCPAPDPWCNAPPADAGAAGTSWNGAVVGAPVVTTIAAVVGLAATGCATNCGGTFETGAFRPGTSCPRTLSPAGSVCGAPVFVELDRVRVSLVAVGDCNGPGCAGEMGDGGAWHWCDTTMTLQDPSAGPNTNLTSIHSEIDQTWKVAGIAPPDPADGLLIDVQGFVFWDPGHVREGFHYFSGWEIHPITAWRVSPGQADAGGGDGG